MSERAVMSELFEQYGDDAEGALAAFANVAPSEWSEFVDHAAMRQYLSKYKAWVRSQTKGYEKASKQASLFAIDDSERVTIRQRIALNIEGRRREFVTTSLAGIEGAAMLRRAAERDERGARTTLIRSKVLTKLAAEVEKRTKREGRDVSVAEVLGEAKAA